jgi:hypothetical protein
MTTFKNRIGFTEVNRPNRVTGTAKRHMRVTPPETVVTPAAGPSLSVPFYSHGPLFADHDDRDGQLVESNLLDDVAVTRDAHRRADLGLAAFFASVVTVLRDERAGLRDRAGSRVNAPLSLFISLEESYNLQASDIRERWEYVGRAALSDDAAVRGGVAQDPYSTSAELAMLAQDEDSSVRTAAAAALADRTAE